MSAEGIVGWDIGGAHLKAASLSQGGVVLHAVQLPCPLWQGLKHLDGALDEALRQLPAAVSCHAVTMTGELVDLFASRAAGVRALIERLSRRLPAASMRIYAGDAGLVAAEQAITIADQVASANWMATAAFLAPLIPQGLLVDIGSTTTDVIAVRGIVRARGRNDHQRMVADELVYTGVVRTPVMAVAQRLPFDGEWLQPMAEHFATMADVYRLTRQLPEHADQMPAADNAGKSMAESARRLARMLGRDAESAPLTSWQRAAEYIAEVQQMRIFDACARVLSRSVLDHEAALIGAGVGRFLVPNLAHRLGRPCVDFSAFVDCHPDAKDWAAACAPAIAVAKLAGRSAGCG